MKKLWLFMYVILLLPSQAQELGEEVIIDEKKLEIQTIDEKDLETYRRNSNFNYTEEIADKNALDRLIIWMRQGLVQILEAIFGSGNVGGILYFIFNILPYVILALLVFLLMRFFLRVDSRNILTNTKNIPLVHFTEEEQLILHEDIKALILEAIKQKNYRLAIRYYYLLTLKILSENNLIIWEQQKTNNDYISELRDDALKSQFEKLTIIYDYVWYGEFTIDAIRFASLQNSFDDLTNNIRGVQ